MVGAAVAVTALRSPLGGRAVLSLLALLAATAGPGAATPETGKAISHRLLIAADGSLSTVKGESEAGAEVLPQQTRSMRRESTVKAHASAADGNASLLVYGRPNASDHSGKQPAVGNSSVNALPPVAAVSWLQETDRGSTGTFAGTTTDTEMEAAMNESASWGWWKPGRGGTGGFTFMDLCKRGSWITGFRIKAGTLVDSIGPNTCHKAKQLPRHGGWGGAEALIALPSGTNEYSLRTGQVVDQICLGGKCQGGHGGLEGDSPCGICSAHNWCTSNIFRWITSSRTMWTSEPACGQRTYRLGGTSVAASGHSTFKCPRGARLAGVKGRVGSLVDHIAFFCGCPSPMRKHGDKCSEPSRDCEWRSWSAWTECSSSCGIGKHQRARGLVPAQHGGKGCRGPTVEERRCHAHPCPTTTGAAVASAVSTVSTTSNGTNGTSTTPKTKSRAAQLPAADWLLLAVVSGLTMSFGDWGL